MEETFRHSIIPTVSFTPHALLDAMLFKQIPVTIRGILATPIGMP
jgi:hypothetical protein